MILHAFMLLLATLLLSDTFSLNICEFIKFGLGLETTLCNCRNFAYLFLYKSSPRDLLIPLFIHSINNSRVSTLCKALPWCIYIGIYTTVNNIDKLIYSEGSF